MHSRFLRTFFVPQAGIPLSGFPGLAGLQGPTGLRGPDFGALSAALSAGSPGSLDVALAAAAGQWASPAGPDVAGRHATGSPRGPAAADASQGPPGAETAGAPTAGSAGSAGSAAAAAGSAGGGGAGTGAGGAGVAEVPGLSPVSTRAAVEHWCTVLTSLGSAAIAGLNRDAVVGLTAGLCATARAEPRRIFCFLLVTRFLHVYIFFDMYVIGIRFRCHPLSFKTMSGQHRRRLIFFNNFQEPR